MNDTPREGSNGTCAVGRHFVAACAQSRTDHLARGFADPPDSAKPRTWWHWTNGNVTEPGITKDLE